MRQLASIVFKLAWPFWLVYFRIFYHRSRIVLISEGKILLVKGYLSAKDNYDLPGGGARLGEDWEKAAVRELAEETGIIIDTTDLEHLLDRENNWNWVKYASHIYVCRLDYVPEVKPQGFEIAGYGWFLPGQVSDISVSKDVLAAVAKLS